MATVIVIKNHCGQPDGIMQKKNNPYIAFYGIISARLVSNFGTFLNMIALNIFILEVTNSTAVLGAAFASRIIAGTVSSFYIGDIADRFNRKFLMVLSDIVLAVFMFLLIFVPKPYVVPYVIFLMVLIGVFSSLFDVSLQAAIPVILNEQDTLKANSIFSGGRNIVIAIAGLCAVFAKELFSGYNSIFALDAASYAFSAVALMLISFKTNREIPRNAREKMTFKNIVNSYKEIAALPNAKIIYVCLGILLIDAFASASHNMGWPIFSKELNPASPMFYYGLILAFWAAGNVAGIYFLNRFEFLHRLAPEKLYIFFTAVMSAGMIMIFQTNSPAVIVMAALIAGMGDGTYQTFYSTYIQKVDDSLRGKVFALTNFVLKTGFGFGFVAVPFVLNVLPVSKTVLYFHGPVIIICAAYLISRSGKK